MIKQIPNHVGYFADTDGNIYSQWINKGIHGLEKGTELKLLKGSTSNKGHKSISFTRKSKRLYVHRLVYETFNGPIPEGLVVRHLNDKAEDNRLLNLAIGTQKENVHDAIKNGVFQRGSFNGQSKLTELDVIAIKNLLNKITQKEIAKMYGVSRRAISFINKNQTWKHVN